MKAKIIKILRQYELNVLEYTDGDLTSGQLYKLCESHADYIIKLYEQERRNAFARGVDWLVHRMHVPQSETR